MKNMITAIIDTEQKYCHAVSNLWQYDYGQILRIQGVTLPAAVEVQFSLTERAGAAITQIGVTKDGVTEVSIPDALLEGGTTSQDYTIYAFVYIEDGESGNTEHRISMKVRARPKPQPYEAPDGSEEASLFQQAIAAVNGSADRAEKAAEVSDSAKTASEEARDVAVAASETATTAAASAETFKGEAEAVRSEAMQAASEVAVAKESIEESRKSVETAKQDAETARAGADQAREAAENAQTVTETIAREAKTEAELLKNEITADREAAVASAEMAQDAAKKSESARQNVEADEEKVQKNVELIENYMNVKYERAYIQSHTFEEATKLAIELDNMRHALVFIRLDPGATASNYGLVSFFDDAGANKGALAELGSLASITSFRTALISFNSGDPVQFTRWSDQGGTGQMVVRNGSVGNYAVGIAQMDCFKLSKIVLPPITGTVNICIWGC